MIKLTDVYNLSFLSLLKINIDKVISIGGWFGDYKIYSKNEGVHLYFRKTNYRFTFITYY